MPQTLYDKIWAAHEVAENLIYIDLHLVHEVTSPQAFDGLRMAGRKVRRAKLYYLRGLRGKRARITEKQDHRGEDADAKA